jgi:hypothetical protein
VTHLRRPLRTVVIAIAGLTTLVGGCATLVLPTHNQTSVEQCTEQFAESVVLREELANSASPVVAAFRDGSTVSLAWPEGFTAALDPLRIMDGRGNVVAAAGERVYLEGHGAGGAGPFAICSIRPAE